MKTVLSLLLSAAALVACAPPVESQTTSRTDGGSIQTKLGFGIVLNKSSSLRRVWVTVHDPERMRVELDGDESGNTGVRTIYKPGDSRYARGEYQYAVTASIRPVTEPISAVEVRYIVFDVWGNRIKTLSATEIVDLGPGGKQIFEWNWRLFSENEASEYYASLGYVAQVRTASGVVLRANTDYILDRAREFSSEITETDLNVDEE
ncbi:MAG: hypothetical protein OXH70_02095 [Acidobacteria bacterium]|nr:hypothetical protein [Acidobacteriota bacterium]MCY3971579.1 hypothetical protein [Acidobacteriota bacterium]